VEGRCRGIGAFEVAVHDRRPAHQDLARLADVGIGMEEFPRLLIWARQIHALPGFITMPGVREVI